MRHLVWMLLIPVLCLGLAGGGHAGSATATMPISITFGGGTTASCVVSASSLDFGIVSGGTFAAQSTITVSCGTGTAYNISLDGGIRGNRSFQSCPVGGGPCSQISLYNLYKDSGHTEIWGDSGFGNTFTSGTPQSGTGTGANQTLTVFGLTGVPSSPPTGTFTDTITVTVNF